MATERQNCMMCNGLMARTFVDYKGRRIHLCQNDANALLRIAFKESPEVLAKSYRSMDEVVYGNETSSIDYETSQPEIPLATSIAQSGQGVL